MTPLRRRKDKNMNNRMAVTTYLSKITLNVNGLNAPVKRYRVVEWIKKKQDPYICCLQRTLFRLKDTHKLQVKKWKKIFHENQNSEESGGSNTLKQRL